MENSCKIIAIVAMDQERVIGCNNQIPWRLPEDMKRFAALTTGHTVVMGRKTYDSLPPSFKPLPKRKNIVLTRNPERMDVPAGVQLFSSLDALKTFCQEQGAELSSDKLWIIGGEQIYRATQYMWDEVYLTLIHSSHQGDSYFPEFEKEFELVDREERTGHSFLRYVRK